MISLYVKNPLLGSTVAGYLDLDDPKITINMEEKSVKEPTSVKVPYSYSFSVPITKHNACLLGMPHSTYTVNKIRLDSTLYVDDFVYDGYIIISSCSRTHYSVNFFGGLGSLYYDLVTKADGSAMSLADILPSSLSGKYFRFHPDELVHYIESNSSYKVGIPYVGANVETDGFVLEFPITRCGYAENQEEKYVYTDSDGETQSVPISEYSSSIGEVDSIAGKYLPYQFADINMNAIQPVLKFSKFFEWLRSWCASKGYTLNASSLSAVQDYGVALTLFSKATPYNSLREYYFSSSYNTVSLEGDDPPYYDISIKFENRGYYEFSSVSYNQVVLVLHGDDDSYIVSANKINDDLKSHFPSGTVYFTPLTENNSTSGVDYKRFDLNLKSGVIYTVSQFFQKIEDRIETAFDPHSIGSDDHWLCLNSSGEGISFSHSLTTNAGGYTYKDGGTKFTTGLVSQFDTVHLGSVISLTGYFSLTETPLYYLVEFLKAFGLHISTSGPSGKILNIVKDYDNPVSTLSNPFGDIEVVEVKPQVYEEGALSVKSASNDDWFSKQYNGVYKNKPLGSAYIKTNSYDEDESSPKEFASTKFKIPAYDLSFVKVLKNPIGFIGRSFTTIAYDTSGSLVDLNGSIFHYANEQYGAGSLRSSVNVSYGNAVVSGGYNNSSPSTYYSSAFIPGNVDNALPLVAYGVYDDRYQWYSRYYDRVSYSKPKYFPGNMSITLDGATNEYANRVSKFYADKPLSGDDAYMSKYIKFRCALGSSMPEIMKAYELPGYGIVYPLKISLSPGKDRVVATVEGLVYTSDNVNPPIVQVTVSASATHGTVYIDGVQASSKTVDSGTPVVVSVTPDSGYTFDHWDDDVYANPRTVVPTADMVLVGTCSQSATEYALTVSDDGHCTVSGSGDYEYGELASISATIVGSSYVFDYWEVTSASGTAVLTDAYSDSTTVRIYGVSSIVAHTRSVVPPPVSTSTINISNVTGATVQLKKGTGSWTTVTLPYTESNVSVGTEVQLRYQSLWSGYNFTKWTTPSGDKTTQTISNTLVAGDNNFSLILTPNAKHKVTLSCDMYISSEWGDVQFQILDQAGNVLSTQYKDSSTGELRCEADVIEGSSFKFNTTWPALPPYAPTSADSRFVDSLGSAISTSFDDPEYPGQMYSSYLTMGTSDVEYGVSLAPYTFTITAGSGISSVSPTSATKRYLSTLSLSGTPSTASNHCKWQYLDGGGTYRDFATGDTYSLRVDKGLLTVLGTSHSMTLRAIAVGSTGHVVQIYSSPVGVASFTATKNGTVQTVNPFSIGANQTIVITANNVSGYDFLGIYSHNGSVRLDTNNVYTFTTSGSDDYGFDLRYDASVPTRTITVTAVDSTGTAISNPPCTLYHKLHSASSYTQIASGGSATYVDGSSVDFRCTIASGSTYTIQKWMVGSSTYYQGADLSGIVISSNVAVKVFLVEDTPVTTYSLKINAVGCTTVPAAGTYTYESAQTVVLSCTPNSRYHFLRWNGDVASPTSQSTSVYVGGDVEVTAVCSEDLFSIVAAPNLYHAGTVSCTVNGNAVSLPYTSARYSDSVALTASAPNEGYEWVKWSDNETSRTHSTITNITANVNLEAIYETDVPVYTVTVVSANNDVLYVNGTEVQSGVPVSYTEGDTVVVTCVPYEPSTATTADRPRYFVNWTESGAVVGTGTSYTITDIDANHVLTANTSPKNCVQLTSNHLDKCRLYVNDVQVTNQTYKFFTPTESAQVRCYVTDRAYGFSSWSDGVSDNPRDLTMTQDYFLTANLAAKIGVTLASSSPSNSILFIREHGASEYTQVSSGYTKYFTYGTVFDIKIQPSSDYRFVEWNSVPATTIFETAEVQNLSATVDIAYTATIAELPVLSVSGNNCTFEVVVNGVTTTYGSSFSEHYPLNTYITSITCVPDTYYVFGQWNDASTYPVKGNITMNADKTYTCTCVLNIVQFNARCVPSSKGSLTAYNITTSSVIDLSGGAVDIAVGTQVRLTARPDAGYEVMNWTAPDGSTFGTGSAEVEVTVTQTGMYYCNLTTE